MQNTSKLQQWAFYAAIYIALGSLTLIFLPIGSGSEAPENVVKLILLLILGSYGFIPVGILAAVSAFLAYKHRKVRVGYFLISTLLTLVGGFIIPFLILVAQD